MMSEHSENKPNPEEKEQVKEGGSDHAPSIKKSDGSKKKDEATSQKHRTSKGSRRSSNRSAKELEIQRLLTAQAEEMAEHEAEMERKRVELEVEAEIREDRKREEMRRAQIDIEYKKQTRIKELRFKQQLHEKEVVLDDTASSRDSGRSIKHLNKTYNLPSPTPSETLKRTLEWTSDTHLLPERNQYREDDQRQSPICVSHPSEINRVELNVNAPEYKPPYTDIGHVSVSGIASQSNMQAVMLKLNMLHSMEPLKFNGDSSKYPVFRERIRNHLEDGLLSEQQRLEFLPKFLQGEALEVMERTSGCSYSAVITMLEDRYGHPAKVAAETLKNLVSFPVLSSSDNKGLLKFSENLETAIKCLSGPYEAEASTLSNLKLIVSRLPNYIINKWGDFCYKLRSKGCTLRLKDLGEFVKKQATIKNDPAFVPLNSNDQFVRCSKGKLPIVNNFGRRTTTLSTDVSQTSAYKSQYKTCACCSQNHNLSKCGEFAVKDLDTRWKIAKEAKVCHACLLPGHLRDKCRVNIHCPCSNNKKHHPLLHNPKESREDYRNSKTCADETEVKKTFDQYATMVETLTLTVLLHVVAVRVFGPHGRSLTTYALLDNGSRGTILDHEFADPLGIRGTKSNVNVNTIIQNQAAQFEIAKFRIQSANGDGPVFEVKEGLITDKFNIHEKVLPHDINLNIYPHLKDLNLPEVDIKKVTILIGKDLPEVHDILEVRRSDGSGHQLQGLRGPLGWVVTGTLQGVLNQSTVSFNFTSVDKDLYGMVERFWKLDEFGTKRMKKLELFEKLETDSIEDKRANAILDRTTQLIDGHYESGLLWKNDSVTLPNNKSHAENRLKSLKRRFEKDENFAEIYTKTMTEYITKGYARKLSDEEMKYTSSKTWYLPHFGVVNQNKPGKVRIVFDAAAEYHGTSLNKQLLTGPDKTNNLVGVLLRFRQDKVALAADVESMFHQVHVRREDQDALRFLWWTNGLDKPIDEYVMTVHIFGAADSPCAANSALLRTAKDNENNFSKEAVKTVENNFYVDDLLKSFASAEDAINIGHEVVDMCKKGGFKLTKFLSNDRRVLGSFPTDLRANPTLNLAFDQLPNSRALGLLWSVELDTLGFKVTDLSKPNTMRGVLSTICSVFDPLNIAAPVMIPAKRLMQELWRNKYSWDQTLEGELLNKWMKWKDNLQLLENVKIPRSYFLRSRNEAQTSVELHHFCDSSEYAYGCSSYLRIVYPNGEIECAYVMGKSRNSPVKSVSIPRLELQGAVLAARVHASLIREIEIDIEETYFWTDSMITLNYINNENRRFQTYVGNRITEIRELTEPKQWYHCPGKLNPADDVSRGLSFEQFSSDSRWIKGPPFLWRPKDHWPSSKIDIIPVEMLEVKKDINMFSPESESDLSKLINKQSNWTSCVRRVSWIVKFVEWLKTNPANRLKIEKCINTEDYDAATKCIVREVQNQSFPDEITSLKEKHFVSHTSNIIRLKPFLSDGIVRVGGRLTKAPILYDAKHPMILPRKHHMTTLIIRYFHESNGHCGLEQVLSLIREKFWILKSRAAIRELMQSCIVCRKRNAIPMGQEMANLPSYRLTPFEIPFTYTGLDYFGPMYVKRSRKVTEKRWGVLFVCMNSRAIHLELAKSLEADDFLLALMRFMNRRGRVKQISSDNGSNFVGAEKEIRECIRKLNSGKVEKYLVERNCKWVFHTPTAAHMSGVWERIVRSVKRSLKAIVGNETINEEVLMTLFTEAERIANSRPLTRNPSCSNDEDPLTPNHFLNLKPTDYMPHEIIVENDKFSKKRWRQCQLLSNHYWNRWLKEYIPTLQKRSKWLKCKRNVGIDDLVLVLEDNTPKNQWLLGRVTAVFPGNDTLVRNVEVKTKNAVLKRPIHKLCLLEAHDCEI